ncbi:MAG: hypothetical protein CML19_18180 [Pusillimonas sp.]|jgi:hypothetical protein|nr:hypothetical protein [Pusillimonas sp.]|tara:strand:- start:16625 stop:17062 length:438 start_codon:yes stop_codon:yes gene_type:complete
MITDAIITHLTTALDGSYRTVAGALDLDRLAKGRGGAAAVKAPAAYVVPQGDRSASNQVGIGETQQRLVERYIVVTALEAKNQRTAAQAEGELEVLRQTLRSALIGWQPDPGRMPMLFVTGRLLAVENGRVWWEDVFETDIWVRV